MFNLILAIFTLDGKQIRGIAAMLFAFSILVGLVDTFISNPAFRTY
jgi:hypothetical protein